MRRLAIIDHGEPAVRCLSAVAELNRESRETHNHDCPVRAGRGIVDRPGGGRGRDVQPGDVRRWQSPQHRPGPSRSRSWSEARVLGSLAMEARSLGCGHTMIGGPDDGHGPAAAEEIAAGPGVRDVFALHPGQSSGQQEPIAPLRHDLRLPGDQRAAAGLRVTSLGDLRPEARDLSQSGRVQPGEDFRPGCP